MYRVSPTMIEGVEHFVFDVVLASDHHERVARFDTLADAVAHAEALNGEAV
jgi:hypothetical protein